MSNKLLNQEEINKLKLYSTKLKYLNKNLEDKLDTKIDYDKARIKELDDLVQKIKEKDEIIADKHDQVKYLRALIDDYKQQISSNTENLEIQLRKISKTYESLLQQKDNIIEKQDETIDNLIKSKEEIIKSFCGEGNLSAFFNFLLTFPRNVIYYY